MFFQENQDQATTIKELIADFERGSGQLLSAEKCSLLFSDNYHDTTQQLVRHMLDVSRDNFEDKYLGFPTPEGRMKRGKF
jgi:hypothetical protein